MRYENEKCPVCGVVFGAEDDVVVCPVCATPHHRSCFNENGKCANEHLHEEGFVWSKASVAEPEKAPEPAKAQEENSDTVTCPECGAINKKKAFSCSDCGMILNEQLMKQFQPPKAGSVFIEGKPVDDNDFIDEEKTVTVAEAAAFIQKSKERYIKTFLDAKVNSRKPKFNFAAFLFGPLWFFFRKIYKAGFAFVGLIVAVMCFVMTFYIKICGEALSFILQNQDALMQETIDEAFYTRVAELISKGVETHPTEIMIMAGLLLLIPVINFVGGIFANKIYLNHIKASVSKIKAISPNNAAYFTYLYAKGGTSLLNAFLVGMAAYYLLQMIFSQALM